MDRSSDVILLGLVAFLGFSAWKKINAAGHLVISQGHVVGIDFIGTTPVLDTELVVQNTSNQDLLLNSVAGNVYSGSELVGNISSFVPITVAGNSQTTIPITATLRILGIVNDIIKAFQEKTGSQQVQIKGYANVSSFQVPIDITFSVGL